MAFGFVDLLKLPALASFRASQVTLVVKNPPANAGDARDSGSIPALGRSPGGGHDNPLQYSSLGNPVEREANVARARPYGLLDSPGSTVYGIL